MSSLPDILSQAYQYHQAGDFLQAEQCYRQILGHDPQHVDALHMFGLLAHQRGRNDVAQELIGEAVRLQPTCAEAHSNLGNVLQQLGKRDEAIASWQRALQLKPHLAEAHSNLGLALTEQGHCDEAAAHLWQAVLLKPDYAGAWCNLGQTLDKQGRFDEAIGCYRQALRLKPDYADAYNNQGIAWEARGQRDEAIACYRRALELQPQLVAAHYNLGNALRIQGRLDEAIVCFRQALQLKPDYADAYSNLGICLEVVGQLDEAIACCRQALVLQPDLVAAHNNLGNTLKAHWRLDEGVACFRRAMELRPADAAIHSNLLLALQYVAGATAESLQAAHAEFDRRHAAPLRTGWKPHDNVRDPGRKLRLGFVSADFGAHPVGYFLIRALENLDPSAAEVVCYSDRVVQDEMTRRFQATAALWRDIVVLSDAQLAEQVRADRIDILFDLAGHTGGTRLLALARKPAPLQITWIGYEGTTGLTAIDYLLADRYVVPSGSEGSYAEQVLRMPASYVCYEPPALAPPVGPLPALAPKPVTFCSCNNPVKITPQVVSVWASILRELPGSRLVLRYRGLDNASVSSRLLAMFAEHGAAAGQVQLRGLTNYANYLTSYSEADIALDPFPFAGGVTTCEALWMGVPVVTCPGETFASRHALSYLSTIGLDELICPNLSEYVKTAIALAGDLPRLAKLRAGIRPRMASSALCDGPRFAQDLLVLLRTAWQKYCGDG